MLHPPKRALREVGWDRRVRNPSSPREVKVLVETSADAAPGSDDKQLRKDLAPDRLEAGMHPSEERLEMPWPQEAQTIFQGIFCVIAMLGHR